MEQYLYKLKLKPELLNQANWTEKENEIVSAHFNYLKNYLNEKTLILAGRTLNNDASTFGIVIFQASSEERAEFIMNNDPAVKAGIMTAQLYPYRVALFNQEFIPNV